MLLGNLKTNATNHQDGSVVSKQQRRWWTCNRGDGGPAGGILRNPAVKFSSIPPAASDPFFHPPPLTGGVAGFPYSSTQARGVASDQYHVSPSHSEGSTMLSILS